MVLSLPLCRISSMQTIPVIITLIPIACCASAYAQQTLRQRALPEKLTLEQMQALPSSNQV